RRTAGSGTSASATRTSSSPVTRIVFITQQVDRAHPVLAATVSKITALAERVDEVAVLADGAVPGTLPENCRVRLFASPLKVGRGLRLESALARRGNDRPEAR